MSCVTVFLYLFFLLLQVYTFGNGDHGKLGHGDVRKVSVPTLVAGLVNMHVIKVCVCVVFCVREAWNLYVHDEKNVHLQAVCVCVVEICSTDPRVYRVCPGRTWYAAVYQGTVLKCAYSVFWMVLPWR